MGMIPIGDGTDVTGATALNKNLTPAPPDFPDWPERFLTAPRLPSDVEPLLPASALLSLLAPPPQPPIPTCRPSSTPTAPPGPLPAHVRPLAKWGSGLRAPPPSRLVKRSDKGTMTCDCNGIFIPDHASVIRVIRPRTSKAPILGDAVSGVGNTARVDTERQSESLHIGPVVRREPWYEENDPKGERRLRIRDAPILRKAVYGAGRPRVGSCARRFGGVGDAVSGVGQGLSCILTRPSCCPPSPSSLSRRGSSASRPKDFATRSAGAR